MTSRQSWITVGASVLCFALGLAIGSALWKPRATPARLITASRIHGTRPSKTLPGNSSDHPDQTVVDISKSSASRAAAVPKKPVDFFYSGKGDRPYSLLDVTGRLTAKAISEVGLSATEQKEVQQVVDSSLLKAERSLVSRMKEDVTHSEPEKGRYAFEILADPERSEAIMDELRKELDSAVGPERADKLRQSYYVDSSPIGLAGKTIRLVAEVPGPENFAKVSYQIITPDTGMINQEGTSSIGAFERRFGRILDFNQEGVDPIR